MFVPLVILFTGGYFGYKALKRRALTAREKQIFDEAFANLKKPEELLELADSFDKEGFSKEATMLRKRAALRNQPPEVYKARRAAFDKAMSVKDPSKVPDIRDLAIEFEKVGAVGTAATLRKYADTLKAV